MSAVRVSAPLPSSLPSRRVRSAPRLFRRPRPGALKSGDPGRLFRFPPVDEVGVSCGGSRATLIYMEVTGK